MALPSKIDWTQAQTFYISNPTVSYKQVAEQYGVSVTAVENRASKEGWAERRERLGEEVISAVEGEVVEKGIDRNEAHTIGARNLQTLIQKKIQIAFNTIKKKEKELGEDNLTVYTEDLISEKRLLDLSSAYLTAVNLERVTLNLPTSVERKEITGRNGTDLFGTGNKEKFLGLMAGLAVEITGGATAPSIPDNDEGSKGSS